MLAKPPPPRTPAPLKWASKPDDPAVGELPIIANAAAAEKTVENFEPTTPEALSADAGPQPRNAV